MKISLMITAGGIGKRFGGKKPKQFSLIQNQSIVEMALSVFSDGLFEECIVTSPKAFMDETKAHISRVKCGFSCEVVEGGKTRAESVQCAFKALTKPCDAVLIHDAVRPYVTKEVIQHVIEGLKNHNVVIPGIPVTDTIKRISNENRVVETLNRDELIAVQTPQGIHCDVLAKAYNRLGLKLGLFTDEASLLESLDQAVYVVEGDRANVKVTYETK